MRGSRGRMGARTRLLTAAATVMLSSMVLIEWRGQVAAQASCFVSLAAGNVQGFGSGRFVWVPRYPLRGHNRGGQPVAAAATSAFMGAGPADRD